MPWRTVLEVAKGISKAGHEALVLSGRNGASGRNWFSGNVEVKEIGKPYDDCFLKTLLLRGRGIDVLFWPVAWHRANHKAKILKKINVPIVWYMPGAHYFVRNVLNSIPHIGMKPALPYLVQAVYPKRYLMKKLTADSKVLMVTMSEFNRRLAIGMGFPSENVIAIMPGKFPFCLFEGGSEVFEKAKQKLQGRPFYLFFGPPTKIRGLNQLLTAFRTVALQCPDLRLVCLFRSDPWVDSEKIRWKIQRTGLAERIICVWKSVSRKDLSVFLNACYAVVLPFLMVPSEIPLAVIETAGHSKPLITTGPGGTSEFAGKFGLTVPAGNSQALASAMMQLLEDKSLYTSKCKMAKETFDSHPTWEDVAGSWLSVAQKAVAKTTL